MNTPICDFVRRYRDSAALRLHMPGHKGSSFLGFESFDITEIDGADSLYEADGIIKESEANAGRLFASYTYYSTEGSSLCIRAMLYLAVMHARQAGKHPLIAAGRNAHKTFLSAAALLDFDLTWLCPTSSDSYLSCHIDPAWLDRFLTEAAETPSAVYLTSPDYLGNTVDIRGIAEVCHRHGCLLLVDNAHGAYLRFLPESSHPIDLGADLCCDSAHKTLPVLTGGAYLHVSSSAPELFWTQAKHALSMFGSTSPSYLILESLDAANHYLADGYAEKLAGFIPNIQAMKARLAAHGFPFAGDEPLKLTIAAKPYGYTGREIADYLLARHIVCEFSDPDFVVMMVTPEIHVSDLARLEECLLSLPKKTPITEVSPRFHRPVRVMTVREAAFSPVEIIPVAESGGRVLAAATVGCPPAVPIVVCGERIDEAAISCFSYYGITNCSVVKEGPL